MKHKLTIITAVLEAIVLLTMKLMDWKEGGSKKPAASKASAVRGHRVVNLATSEYIDGSPKGESSAAYVLAGSGPADEKIHKKE